MFKIKNSCLRKSIIPILLLTTYFCTALTPVFAQQKKPQLTLQDIFASIKFRGKRFRQGKWSESGPLITYTKRDTTGIGHLISLDLASNQERRILDGSKLYAADVDKNIAIEDYAYNTAKTKVLIYTDSERVWRLNTKGYYYIYDIKKEELVPLSLREKGYQMFAKFSPNGQYIAFVRNRNLFLLDLNTMEERELTNNGSEGKIINGTTDWVYEEELNLRDGWTWSPDSKYIAFYQFDESKTSEFCMVDLRGEQPKDICFRFPYVGEDNSEVRVGVININNKKIDFFDTGTWNSGDESFEYIPRMGWTPKINDKYQVWMIRMNRDQNYAEIVYGFPGNDKVKTILKEEADSWIEVVSFFRDASFISFLDDNKHFIWLSERSGFQHIYLYENSGNLVRQVTSGEWNVTEVHGIDTATETIYFSATAESPRESHLYRNKLYSGKPSKPSKITKQPGIHRINLSADHQYFIDTYNNINNPSVTYLNKSDGNLIKVLEDNLELKETLASYQLPQFEFQTIKAADGETALNASILKPSYFDPANTYPLLIYTYGGPGVQQVTNRWGGAVGLWHAYLAETYGIIVASVDNRGASGYGKDFSSLIYKNLGTLEAQDQIAAAKYWGALPYIDKNRIGMWGASYGGYNTFMSMMKYDGPTTIKFGIAMSSGVDFKRYDTIYTERYMSTPDKNEDGYKESNPIHFVDQLQDNQNLLIIHGDLDDNAHYQGVISLISALQRANKQFRFMVYPGGNHGYAGTGNPYTFLHIFTMITEFIVENI